MVGEGLESDGIFLGSSLFSSVVVGEVLELDGIFLGSSSFSSSLSLSSLYLFLLSSNPLPDVRYS